MSANPKIHALQALRAIAASLVVVDHTLLELTGNRAGDKLTSLAWILGSVGVYTFFVVSGFIMVHVSWAQFGGVRESLGFFRRRIIRIVPLYWLGTLAALGFHRISATHGAQDGLRELAYSFAFVPYPGDDGAMSPILPQGWTLNYEMMFYVVFALGLCAPRQFGLPAVCAALFAFVLAGPQFHQASVAYLASPIILWFLLGIVLAVVWRYAKLSEPQMDQPAGAVVGAHRRRVLLPLSRARSDPDLAAKDLDRRRRRSVALSSADQPSCCNRCRPGDLRRHRKAPIGTLD